MVLGEVKMVPTDVLVDRLLNDGDPRVRANAIEVLESRPQTNLVAVLSSRAYPRTAANAPMPSRRCMR